MFGFFVPTDFGESNMKHPFDLQLSELESLGVEFQDVSDEQAADIVGGVSIITQACFETGCSSSQPIRFVPNLPSVPSRGGFSRSLPSIPARGGFSRSLPSIPGRDNNPRFTTMAIGEEGGDPNFGGEVTDLTDN